MSIPLSKNDTMYVYLWSKQVFLYGLSERNHPQPFHLSAQASNRVKLHLHLRGFESERFRPATTSSSAIWRGLSSLG